MRDPWVGLHTLKQLTKKNTEDITNNRKILRKIQQTRNNNNMQIVHNQSIGNHGNRDYCARNYENSASTIGMYGEKGKCTKLQLNLSRRKASQNLPTLS